MQMYFIQSFFSHGKPAIYLRLFLLTFQKALFVCHGSGVKFNLCIVLSASGYVLYDRYKYFDQDERRLCGFLFYAKTYKHTVQFCDFELTCEKYLIA